MTFGLFACGKKPVENPDGADSSNAATGSGSGNTDNGGQMGGGLINPGGYTGETLANEGSQGLAGEIENVITSNDELINPNFI